MNIEAIVFDVDNTLLDFHKMKLQSTQAGIDKMMERGFPITPDEGKRITTEVFRNHGWEDPKLFLNIALMAGVTKPATLERYAQIGKVAYREKQREHLKPYEGVVETLDALKKQGIQFAILSDAPRFKVFDRICDIGLEPYFEDNVVGGEADEFKKPHPAAFKAVLECLGRKDASNVLMVGDQPIRDILGAKNYGFSTAWAKYGYTPSHGEDVNTVKTRADYTLEKFSDLVRIIRPTG